MPEVGLYRSTSSYKLRHTTQVSQHMFFETWNPARKFLGAVTSLTDFVNPVRLHEREHVVDISCKFLGLRRVWSDT